MTLGEFKEKVYSLIEEYNQTEANLTEDEDLAQKFNGCADIIQNEMSRFKKIHSYTTRNVEKNDNIELKDIDNDLYQINIIRGVEYEIIGNRVIFKEDGTVEIYYYKYPTKIDNSTIDTHELEIDSDALDIMALGVAGLLLASDVSNSYGQVYTNMYREKISQLDSRNAMNSVYITGGVDI